MVWLPETFRKERSLAWRKAMRASKAHDLAILQKARKDLPDATPAEGRKSKTAFTAPTPSQLERIGPGLGQPQASAGFSAMSRIVSGLSLRSGEDNVKIHFRDVNVRIPFPFSFPVTFLLVPGSVPDHHSLPFFTALGRSRRRPSPAA